MGTEIQVVVDQEPAPSGEANGRLDEVACLFRAAEQRFSRFAADSELSELNRMGFLDRPSRDLLDVAARSIKWFEITGGAFNPSILSALESAGYDVDFDSMTGCIRAGLPRPVAGATCGLKIHERDTGHPQIELAEGVRIDSGGIVKGWTADRACDLSSDGTGMFVDAGGDIAIRGGKRDGGPWMVGVAHPDRTYELIDVIAVKSGGVSTSSVRARSWASGDGRAHHIIDPTTGIPTNSGVIQATVVGRSAESAEVLAKSVVVLGAEEGLTLLDSFRDTEGILVLSDGDILESSGWSNLRLEEPRAMAWSG